MGVLLCLCSFVHIPLTGCTGPCVRCPWGTNMSLSGSLMSSAAPSLVGEKFPLHPSFLCVPWKTAAYPAVWLRREGEMAASIIMPLLGSKGIQEEPPR